MTRRPVRFWRRACSGLTWSCLWWPSLRYDAGVFWPASHPLLLFWAPSPWPSWAGAVPTLRGLVEQLPGLSPSGRWAALLILASSLVVSFVTLRRIHNGRDSVIFVSVLAAVTTILISFHALVYDISLLLPMALFLLSRALGVGGAKIDAGTILLFTLLLLTPLYVFLWLVVERFVWFSLILLWLYLRLVLTPAPAEAPA